MKTTHSELRTFLACLAGAIVLSLPGTAAAATAGRVQFVTGDVRVQAQGIERSLRKGDTVNEGDTILSGATGEAQVKMVDDALVAVRRDTQLRIDQYNYQGKNDGTESGLLSLVKGTFRAFTGLIVKANKQNFAMKTPVATIGIRGTGNITHHDAVANSTINHTVTGSHSVTSVTPEGVFGTVITNPGQTIQVQRGQPPRQIPTPAFIKEQASTDPKEQKKEPEKKEEAKKEEARSDTLKKAETETRETQPEQPKEEPKPAPTAQPTPTAPTPVVEVKVEVKAPSTSEQQLEGSNLRTQIEGSFTAASNACGYDGTGCASLLSFLSSAQSAASNASTSATSASTLSPVDLASADSAISSASSTISSAQSAVTSALALTAADATLASSRTSQASSLKSTADSQVSTANSAYSANSNVTNGVGGTDFRDSTAISAKSAMDAAKTQLDTAVSNVQTQASLVTSKNTALASAQQSANTALGTANTSLQAAQGDRSAAFSAAGLGNASSTLALAQSAANAAATSASASNSAAQTAAAAAQTAFQAALAAYNAALAALNANNFTTAQQQFDILSAKSAETIAKQQETAAAASAGQAAEKTASSKLAEGQTAITTATGKRDSSISSATATGVAATTASSAASAAQTAKAAADIALTATGTELTAAQTTAPSVQQNAVIAQYSNPTIATTNRFGSLALSVKRLGTGSNERAISSADAKSNTNYVLDGSKNVVEIRDTAHQVDQIGAAPNPNLANADVTFAGGTAKDNFVAFDSSKPNYVALGRWEGGTITVPGAPTIDLTTGTANPRSAHWIVGYLPAPFKVQSLSGTTTYTKLANTSPTDASGNVGTLNSATLAASFDTQTVSAGVNLTIASKTLGATASNMPIVGNYFTGNFGTVTCSTGCTYTGDVLGSFAGEDVTGAGFGYNLWPSAASGPYSDLIQGVVAFSTTSAPPVAPTIAIATNAANAAATSNTNAQAAVTAVNTAISSATTSNTSVLAISPADTTPATTAISAATTAIGNTSSGATKAVNDASALSLASSQTTAASNATTAAGLKTTADTQVSSATAAYTANSNVTNGVGGTDFRDSTALTAKGIMDSAKSSLDSANTQVQSAKTTIDTQVTTLASAKSSATTALSNANTALSSANTSLTTANAENGKIGPAQTAASSDLSTASAQLSIAQTAAGSGTTTLDPSPTTANSSFASGCGAAKACADLAAQYASATASATPGSAAQLNAKNNALTAANRAATFEATATTAKTTAQSATTDAATQLTTAQSAFSAASTAVSSSATSAGTGATGAQGQATAANTAATGAQTAFSTGSTALSTSNTQLSAVQGNATSVASQSVIAQYNNPTIVSTNRFASLALAVNNVSAGNNEGVKAGADLQPNTTYVLDGNKNLVEIRHTDYQSAPGITPSVSFTDADVKFSGGTPFDNFVAFDPSNPKYVALGRWQGGTIAADNAANGVGVDHTVTLGPRSAHWLIAFVPGGGYVQSLTGSTTYTKLANTSPTDAAGTVGTLNSATLAANFLTQTVNAGVNLTVASKTLDAMATNVPILGNFFQGGFGTVTCSPSCSYTGYLQGAFAGQNAAGAGFGYDLWPSADTTTYSDLIQGVVAFSTSTPPKAAGSVVVNGYLYNLGGGNVGTTTNTYEALPTGVTTDGAGNLVSVTDAEHGTSATVSGATPVTLGQGTTRPAVSFGRWSGGTVTGIDFGGSFSRTLLGNYHWVKGPEIGPFYLPMALTGSMSYTIDGSTAPTDQAGVAGTLDTNPLNTLLAVDFTKQSVNAKVTATTGAGAWVGTATNVRLDGGGEFSAFTGSTGPHESMTVTLGGSSTGTFGGISGHLMGTGLNAAGLTYAFGGPGTVGNVEVSGAIAYSATAQNTAAPYYVGIVVAGMTNAGQFDPELNHAVGAGVNAASRVVIDGAGVVTRFDGDFPKAHGSGCPPTCQISNTPATFTPQESLFASPPSPGGTTPANVYAAAPDSGKDATTGISWGRYVGFMGVKDRIDNSNLVSPDIALDIRNNNWHGIFSAQQTAPTVLPTTGSATYTVFAKTTPTDNVGATGTLGTVTLGADFAAQTVNTALNISGAVGTWSASANNVPIQKGAFFEASKVGGTGNLTVTSSVAGTTAGTVVGAFTGTSGQQAIMGYSLNAGGNVASNTAARTVSGVIGLKQ